MSKICRIFAAAVACAAASFAVAAPQNGPSNANPRIIVETPGYGNPRDAVNADVLIQSVQFADGLEVGADKLRFPGQIVEMSYAGPTEAFRVVNGELATVGTAGVSYIEAQDNVPATISSLDRSLFCQRIENAFANRNLNNRVHLASQTGYSFVIGLESRIWDSHFALDQRPEILIFEEQGNSVLTVQALNDAMQPVGTAVEIRAVDIRSIRPQKIWVGRFDQNGDWQPGTYEAKLAAIDLTSLGVDSVKFLRISTSISNGGEASADLKIVAVETSPTPAAEPAAFD
ncbi:MAG: hypothetical protein LW636_01305 [Planctomycetaceae bacterium]|nr:hypothetical protein [Planctomycetaceae bacterium]